MRRQRRPRRSFVESEPEVEREEVEEEPKPTEEIPSRRTARVFGTDADNQEAPRRRRSRRVTEPVEEPESTPEPIPEPEPSVPAPVQRRRRVRQRPIEEVPEPEPVVEVEPDPVSAPESESEPTEEEVEEKVKPKRGRPSKQKPRKIMGPEVRPRQKRAVVFEESPQSVTVREAEPEEIVSPFQEPLMVDADDETPVLTFDPTAVPKRRVRLEPQLTRTIPPSPEKAEPEEHVSDSEQGAEPEEESHLPVLLTSDELLNTLCALLDRDYSILMSKVGNRYVLKQGGQDIPRSRFPMTKEQADLIASTDEYKAFSERWTEMSEKERVSYAKKLGVEHDGDPTTVTAGARLKRSVMKVEGISKWKREYDRKEDRVRLWKEGIYAKLL